MSDEGGMGMNNILVLYSATTVRFSNTYPSPWVKFNPHSSAFPIHPRCLVYIDVGRLKVKKRQVPKRNIPKSLVEHWPPILRPVLTWHRSNAHFIINSCIFFK